MQKMKRILAMIAMIAVLLTSFGFAEEPVLVENHEHVEEIEQLPAEVSAAEVPVEEPAEEILTEEPAEEPAVEPAAVETPAEENTDAAEFSLSAQAACEHVIQCSNPICLVCGERVNPADCMFIDHQWEDANQRHIWIDNGNGTHTEKCFSCGDFGVTLDHWMSCLKSGECYDCGAPLNPEDHNYGHYTYIDAENRENWVDFGDGTHAMKCLRCGKEFHHGLHYQVCPAIGVCAECHLPVNPEENHIIHDSWIPEENRENYVLLANGNWAVKCLHCDEIWNEHECWVRCGTQGVCAQCGNPCNGEPQHDNWDPYQEIHLDVKLENGNIACICFYCGETYGEHEDDEPHSCLSSCKNPNVCWGCGGYTAEVVHQDLMDAGDNELPWELYPADKSRCGQRCYTCNTWIDTQAHFNSCAKPGQCIRCGVSMSGEPGHNYDWNDTTNQPWVPVPGDIYRCGVHCKDCGLWEHKEGHEDEDNNAICDRCASVVPKCTNHVAGEMQADEYGHWKACVNCGEKMESDKHHATCASGSCIFCGYSVAKSNDASVTIHHAQTERFYCSVCNAYVGDVEAEEAHHDWSRKWYNDESCALYCEICDRWFHLVEHGSEDPDSNICDLCGSEFDPEDGGECQHNAYIEDGSLTGKFNSVPSNKQGMHIEICVECGEEMGEQPHRALCWKPTVCVDCGAVNAKGWDEDFYCGHEVECKYNGNGSHSVICKNCNRVFFEEEKCFYHCDAADKSVCFSCGNASKNMDEWHAPFQEEEDANGDGICDRCGDKLNGEDDDDFNDCHKDIWAAWDDATELFNARPDPANPSKHILICLECDKEFASDVHHAFCGEPTVCIDCGAVNSNGWDPDFYCGHEAEIKYNGNGSHSVICKHCDRVFHEAEKCYAFCWAEDKNTCEACGQHFDKELELWHNPHGDDPITDQYGNCANCGQNLSALEDVELDAYELTMGVKQDGISIGVIITGGYTRIDYASSSKKVADIDEYGVITAKKTGSAKITVTVTGVDGTQISEVCQLKVKKAPASVKLNSTKMTLGVGECSQLKATLSSGSYSPLEWESSNEAIVRVDENGAITPVAPGTAKVKVSTYNNKSAACTITVKAAPTAIEVNAAELDLIVKKTFTLKAKLVNDEGSECAGAVKFESSNPGIVTVDAKGKLTAKKASTEAAIITVSAYNGIKKEIAVRVWVNPTKVTLDVDKTATLNKGETLQLNAKVAENAYASFKWTSSSKKVATVDANGMVTAIGEGTTTIKVKTQNGKTDSVKVKVVDPTKATKVELDQSGTVPLKVGETLQLNAAVKPDTAVETTQLKWSSSKSSCAKVDQDGLVTAVKAGTATITVKTNTGKTDTVKIKVVK